MASNVYTSAGEAKVIDLMDTVSWYGDSGTGTVAAAKTDTALGTPSGLARVATTDTQPAADKLQMVFTQTYASAKAITECGIFDALTGGNMLQRHTFDPINVAAGDSIQFTVIHEQA